MQGLKFQDGAASSVSQRGGGVHASPLDRPGIKIPSVRCSIAQSPIQSHPRVVVDHRVVGFPLISDQHRRSGRDLPDQTDEGQIGTDILGQKIGRRGFCIEQEAGVKLTRAQSGLQLEISIIQLLFDLEFDLVLVPRAVAAHPQLEAIQGVALLGQAKIMEGRVELKRRDFILGGEPLQCGSGSQNCRTKLRIPSIDRRSMMYLNS